MGFGRSGKNDPGENLNCAVFDTLLVFVLAMLVNALPFILAVAIKFPNKIKSDDLWGISALFAGCSLAGLVIGALANNFRKELSGFASWFKGEKGN